MPSLTNSLQLQSTAGILAAKIRDGILDGELRPGDPLPQEEMAAQFGVSRSPLREALRQLEAEGWIVYHPNRGAFVAHVSAGDVRELYEVRRILESAAIAAAVNEMDDERIRTMRGIDAAMRKVPGMREKIALHAQFHEMLYSGVANERLKAAIAAHRVRVPQLPDFATRYSAIMKRTRADHRSILSALERRDTVAAKRAVLAELDHNESIMTEHLE